LLEKLGVEVDYPFDQTCCGQPMANSVGVTVHPADAVSRPKTAGGRKLGRVDEVG